MMGLLYDFEYWKATGTVDRLSVFSANVHLI